MIGGDNDWSSVVLVALIRKLGGKVEISRKELIEIQDVKIELEENVIGGSIIFHLEDDRVIQGVLV